MPIRHRTCDRCYRIKVRCHRDEGLDECERCIRLGFQCEIRRPIRRPGPRVQHNHDAEESHEDGMLMSRLNQEIPSGLDDFSHAIRHFDQTEMILLEFMLDKPAFISRYVEGPTFQEELRGMLVCQLILNPQLLKEGYLACVGYVHGLHIPRLALESRDKTIERSSRALRTLSSMRAGTALEVSTMLTLAMALITSSTQLTGLPSRPITQAALQMTKPWIMHNGWDLVTHDSNFLCMVMHETIDCLIIRELPTIRLEHIVTYRVDRYLGISVSIQPILYDLAQFGWRSRNHKCKLSDSSSNEAEAMLQSLTDIWNRINRWTPVRPTEALPKLAPLQARLIESQVACFQLTAKLLVLEYSAFLFDNAQLPSLGLPLDNPRYVAHSIMAHLEVFSRPTSNCRRYITFPYFVAALTLGSRPNAADLEIDDQDYQLYRDELADRLRLYTNGTSDACCERMVEFAQTTWKEQDHTSERLSWLEMIDRTASFSIGI